VGRGTFVSLAGGQRTSGEAAHDRVIDLSLNIVPHEAAARRLLSTSPGKRNSDLLDGLAYSPAPGPDVHRRAAVTWLSRVANFEPEWTRLLMTTGAQQAMSWFLNYSADRKTRSCVRQPHSSVCNGWPSIAVTPFTA
jgi:DNA-binding transcriptional MocR family regulator